MFILKSLNGGIETNKIEHKKENKLKLICRKRKHFNTIEHVEAIIKVQLEFV